MGPDNIEAKRMYSASDRRKLADSGDALPDGSFPIKNVDDLKNAIAAFGRAKDPEAAKDHIIKRATELDAEDMIPQTWGTKNVDDNEAAQPAADKEPMGAKGIVKISGDGEVTKCAKGLATGDCGYKPGGKVCVKCGAMAVQTKGDDADEVFEFEDGLVAGEIGRLDIVDEHEIDAVRRVYLEEIGTKSADIDGGAFVCMVEQEVFSGETGPCADCTGGCIGSKGLLDLAAMEAVTAKVWGTVVDSGYSEVADRFLVTCERKDGLFEVHYSGDGQFQGLVRVDEDMIADGPVITAEEATDAATSIVEGKALAVGAASYEGYDVYSIEVKGIDGNSYDVYVDPSSGTVLGHDMYEISADEMEALEGVHAKSAEDSAFEAALMEFQLLEAEQDTTVTDEQ
jgi:hypothetical protein